MRVNWSIAGRRIGAATLIAGLLVVATGACRITSPEADPALSFGGGTSFGECLGYCVVELTVTEQTTELARLGHGGAMFPDRLYSWPTDARTWSRLTGSIDMNRFGKLDDVYGCPDCADGGAEWVEVRSTDSDKRITFEFGASVDGAGDLIEALRTLRTDLLHRIDADT